MERATVTAITLVCVLFCEHQKVFGTEVNMRVKPGENITLYCDRVVPLGSHIIWMRNCSHENQPSLFIDPSEMFQWMFTRFSCVLNSSSKSYDLHIENVSVSDEGLYYCAIKEREVKRIAGLIFGNTTFRLSVLEPVSTQGEGINPTSTLPATDCLLCFKLLFGVSLLFVLLFSICVYLLCQKKKTTVSAETETENRLCESESGVCYASLNKTSKLNKKKPQSSDFSIYTEVRTKRK